MCYETNLSLVSLKYGLAIKCMYNMAWTATGKDLVPKNMWEWMPELWANGGIESCWQIDGLEKKLICRYAKNLRPIGLNTSHITVCICVHLDPVIVIICRHFRRIAIIDSSFRHVCSHGTTRLLLGGFSRNLIFENF